MSTPEKIVFDHFEVTTDALATSWLDARLNGVRAGDFIWGS